MLARIAAFAVVSIAAATSLAGAQDAPPSSASVMISSFTVGDVDPSGKVPTVNGVTGAGVTNWDIALPLSALNSGTRYVYSLTFQVMNFTGTCNSTYKLTQVQAGETVTLDSGAILAGFSCSPDIFLIHGTGHPIPASPGPATLTAVVKYGSNKVMVHVPVVIQ